MTVVVTGVAVLSLIELVTVVAAATMAEAVHLGSPKVTRFS